MAAFDLNDSLSGDRAFRLVENTFVTMFWSKDLFVETLGWLTLRNYDAFVRRDAAFAHRILDIVAKQCRSGALIGHRMMCLVQSNDPDLVIPPVGATPVVWNDAEWLDARRRGEGVDTPTVTGSWPSVGSSTRIQHNRCAAGKPRAVGIGSVLAEALAGIPRALGRLLSWSAAQRRRW
ncbi:hypothetical protein ABIB25_004881 [Nakamurella sp. UYEF19]|uniref:hypothetical protein n=1 Tax=Nakamurella sp. UYEF19 TaxID=1756392 RepID=UPI0033909152